MKKVEEYCKVEDDALHVKVGQKDLETVTPALISFDDTNLERWILPHDDALVIELHMNRFIVKRVLIDQGNTSEIMYYKTFPKLSFTDSDLQPAEYPFFDFNANLEYPIGKITLPVRAGTRSIDMELLVVKLSLPYNIIMGRTWLHAM
ncbi:uncharacterized protein LOC114286215 [Camellia sinensis]|uniref:uncharacterized protein LOC114286215 n=1 Tax=Camellia sinensis TaxID=4442 RepID=UPI001035854F|nr:uncharacterized protein LOC114286215 [Camellia sinensis]